MATIRPITTRRSQALHRIRPGGGPDDRTRWQQRKSSMTREAILEAAVDSLVDTGYAGLSTNDVARASRAVRCITISLRAPIWSRG